MSPGRASAVTPAARRRRPVRESVRAGARGAFRGAILSAAERVFANTGFYATRMTDIAKEAGVGVGTLYNYFDSKELIFSEIVSARQKEFRVTIEAAAVAEDPLERLRQVVATCLSCLDESGALLAVFMERGAIGEYDMERLLGAKTARGYADFLDLLEKVVRAAVRAKRIRTDLDPRLLVTTLSGAMNGAAYSWFKRGRKGRLSALTAELLELFLEGARQK